MDISKKIAIKVENISKSFRIYNRQSDRLKELFSLSRKKYSSDFLALQGINFDIYQGEFVGILGRNGAGKSTLLRLLSNELTPTSGKIETHGTVSLLQLGVGFDPELTGIENARFSSKILGYNDTQIDFMLKEIIDFAELGEFINYPVKTYSSGMYSRLSFSVGININPDILIADEVLAVGDLRFSQKCLRKMHEFKKSGKTVILVTHDTNTIGVFCDKAIWLKDGKILEQGEAKSVAENYKNYMLYDRFPVKAATTKESNQSEIKLDLEKLELIVPKKTTTNSSIPKIPFQNIQWMNVSESPQISNNKAQILKAALIKESTMKNATVFHPNESLFLCIQCKVFENFNDPWFGFIVYDQHGLIVIHSNSNNCGHRFEHLKSDTNYLVIFRIQLPPLNNGLFSFCVSINTSKEMYNRVHNITAFEIKNNTSNQEQCGYILIEKQDFSLYELGNL